MTETMTTTDEYSRTVYIETSVVSYLTARPTSSLLAAAWQKATVGLVGHAQVTVQYLYI